MSLWRRLTPFIVVELAKHVAVSNVLHPAAGRTRTSQELGTALFQYSFAQSEHYLLLGQQRRRVNVGVKPM